MQVTREQFEQDYTIISRKISSVLFKLGCPLDQIEDFSQIAFTKAWAKKESFQGLCSLTTWIVKIAINEYLQSKRVTRRFVDVIEIDKNKPVIPKEYEKLLVNELINFLPMFYKTLVYNYYILGMDQEGTVQITKRTRRLRARKMLLLIASGVEPSEAILVVNHPKRRRKV